MSGESARLPSLLMEAARSAAVADGLIDKSPEVKSIQITHNRILTHLPSVEEDAATKEATAAALAMVAAKNNSLQALSTAAEVSRTQQANDLAKYLIEASKKEKAEKAILDASNARHRVEQSREIPSSSRSRPENVRVKLVAASAKTSVPSTSTTSHGQSSSNKKKGPPLRRGKWTAEEEAYANRLILEFKAGLLPLTDGTTLRTFLSKLLNCDPMRISKKFVGNNCIGKQVFRRRTADINRLTSDQIRQSRSELSDLERRFLERVAQTNRVKSNNNAVGGSSSITAKIKEESEEEDESPPSPPWLRVPSMLRDTENQGNMNYKAPSSTSSRAAAAGRALLQGDRPNAGGRGGGVSATYNSQTERQQMKQNLTPSTNHSSSGLLAMAELHRRHSQQSLLQSMASNLASKNSASNFLNTFSGNAIGNTGGSSGLSGPAMAQIARNASAARLAGITASGHSMNNLMLKTGLSRDQLSQLARDQRINSVNSLTNLMERKSSFDALMSLDLQSMQSIDNLANLIQLGGGVPGQVTPRSGLKNWSALDAAGATGSASGGSLAGLANARRVASDGRIESILQSLSNGNIGGGLGSGLGSGLGNGLVNGLGGGGLPSTNSLVGVGSNANFVHLLQNINTGNNLFGSGSQLSAANAMSLANLLRVDSSTGLTALRMQDGLVQRNSSVDDFLSLVASGDIPHQDPHLLNIPLQSMLQQQQDAAHAQGTLAAANYLAHQQLLSQAAHKGSNTSLSNAMRMSTSAASRLNQYASMQGSADVAKATAEAYLQQQEHANAGHINMGDSSMVPPRNRDRNNSISGLKRKLNDDGNAS